MSHSVRYSSCLNTATFHDLSKDNPVFSQQAVTVLVFCAVQMLLPPVVACVEDSFYKITSEALLVTQQLVKVMRPLDQTAAPGGFDPKPFIKEVRLYFSDFDYYKERQMHLCHFLYFFFCSRCFLQL